MNKNSNIFERIEYIASIKGFKSISKLAEYLGYNSPQKLYRLRASDLKPSFDIIHDFSIKFEYLNIRWLLTGRGEPFFREESTSNSASSHIPDNKNEHLFNLMKDQIKGLKRELSAKDKIIQLLEEQKDELLKKIHSEPQTLDRITPTQPQKEKRSQPGER